MLMLHAVVSTGSACEAPDGLLRLDGARAGVLYQERSEPPQHERADLLAFGEALLAVMAGTTLLPMRFGTVVDSVDDVRAVLDEHEDAWHRRLSEIAGHQEMLVRLPVRSTPPATTGVEYLMTKVEAKQEAELVAAWLTDLVRPLVREHRLLTGDVGPRLACLVHRDAVEEFRAAVEGAGRNAARTFLCTGPWPPFSFSEASA
jgi:Gas vesicle synthesis protein GvpL/GvpF